MASGTGVPLTGPGPPHSPQAGSHLCRIATRKSGAHPPTLELPAPKTFEGLHFARFPPQERGRTQLPSNPTPLDVVADLFWQCTCVFLTESPVHHSLLLCEASASDALPSNACHKSAQLVAPGGLRYLQPGLRKLAGDADVVLHSRDRSRSIGKVLRKQLEKTFTTGGCLGILASKPATDCSEANLSWLRARSCAEWVAAYSSFREDEFLALPCRLEACRDYHKHIGSKASMGYLEGASRRPKGWEVIKAGMEYVLGRSILPARGAQLSDVSLRDCADASGIAHGTRLGTNHRNSLSSPLAGSATIIPSQQSDSGVRVGLQVTAEPVEISKRTKDIKQGPSPSPLSGRMGHNAVAGALAGTCVSLCLHPVDTVKTVIQAQSFGQRSILHTLVAIISDRGVSGLYRGLGSNLASSAPISAIYAFTYESVKAALLPHLPKEYHAIAHCTAGGCASIATSIVYTPSECVKQRMQVGNLYRNSWLAFLGLFKDGGLSVLYSGWGAVLCRNVPQSVIKFYTYEGLKHYALAEQPVGTSLSTWQTLAFGGLAGSTAALFTTPFDVIKTRLQTQVPGSIMHQHGVVQAFQHIAASEGLRGLYRGLIPRLVIYVSQGALFFASYELFKRLLAVEVGKLSLYSSQSHSRGMVGQVNVLESP